MNQNTLLSGIKVVEMSTYVAGPSCAHILADWGAEVIKVEPPQGDAWRYVGGSLVSDEDNPVFSADNANKKFLALNTKTPDGVAVLKKLLKTADVFVTNIRTVALEKMGLSYEEISRVNPQIIYTIALGYGMDGPLKNKPGFDGTSFFARGCVAGDLGQKGEAPANPGPGFGDHVLGTNLLCGTLAALFNRTKTGKGELVTSSLYQSAIYLLSSMVGLSQLGVEYPMSRLNPSNAVNNIYPCKDGKWIMLAGASWAVYFPKFCKITGHEEHTKNEKYMDPVAGLTIGDELAKIVGEIMITKTRREWVEILTENDFPHEIIQHIPDMLSDEQAWDNQYLMEEKFSTGNTRIFCRAPIFFDSQPLTDFVNTSSIGADTQEVLTDAGYSKDDIRQLMSNGVVK